MRKYFAGVRRAFCAWSSHYIIDMRVLARYSLSLIMDCGFYSIINAWHVS
jgi:hypothetical protein